MVKSLSILVLAALWVSFHTSIIFFICICWDIRISIKYCICYWKILYLCAYHAGNYEAFVAQIGKRKIKLLLPISIATQLVKFCNCFSGSFLSLKLYSVLKCFSQILIIAKLEHICWNNKDDWKAGAFLCI